MTDRPEPPSSTPPPPLSPSPSPSRDDVTLDTAALRVLAHPMRLALLNRLRREGPATVRGLAAHFELDSGAASYHLRRLAAGGLIEEAAELGNKRDRWWRAVHRMSLHDPAVQGGAEGRAYVQAVAVAAADTLRRAASETVPSMPEEWFEATAFSDYELNLAPAELAALKDELTAVVHRYRDRRPAAGAAPVSVQFQAFPRDTTGL